MGVMMKNNKSFLGLFLAVLVLLPGCMHVPTYQRKSLKSVNDHCTYRGAEKNVIMRAKKLSQAEKNYLFGDRNRLINDELQGIYVSVHNLGNVPYVFSHDHIYVRQIKYGDVIRSMRKTSSIVRLTGSALIAWPVLPVAIVLSPVAIVPIMVPILTAGMVGFLAGFSAVGGVLSLTFLAYGIKSIVMNRRISKDLKEKTLHEKVTINPGDSYEGLMFVKAVDYNPQFSVTMHEKDNRNNTVTFDVDLRQNKE